MVQRIKYEINDLYDIVQSEIHLVMEIEMLAKSTKVVGEASGRQSNSAKQAPVKTPAPTKAAKPKVAAAEEKPVTVAKLTKAAKAAKVTNAIKEAKTAKAVKSVKQEKPIKTDKSANSADASAPDRAKKQRLIRDSFTMPEVEYQVLGHIKKQCLSGGIEVKKSELLRIGVALLGRLDRAALTAELERLVKLRSGRPRK